MLIVNMSILSVTAFPKNFGPWDNKNDWEKMLEEKIGEINETIIEKELNELEKKFNTTREHIREKWRHTKRIYASLKKNHSFFGSISYENDFAAGDLIKFILNESTGEILSYTLNRNDNVTVFDYITFEKPVVKKRLIVRGAVLIYDGSSIIIDAHDNPTGLLKIKSRVNNTVTIAVSSELSISKVADNIISISGNNLSGKIIISNLTETGNFSYEIEINDNTITITLSKEQSILFLALPPRELTINIPNWQDRENKIISCIAKKRIGARILVQLKNRIQNRTNVMTYANLSINCSVQPGKMVVKVSSNETGKSIIIDADNSTFNVTNANKLEVMIDNESIKMASNYSDVLDPTNDGNESEYLVVVGSNGVQVLVSIPKFSPHTIVITESTEGATTPTSETPGFTIFILLVAIITLLIFSTVKRKR
jgi:hypothetical protein